MGQALLVPSLGSQRVRLEPMSRAHSDGMFAMWSHPDVCRFAGPAADLEGRPITLPAVDPSDSDKIIAFFVKSAAAGIRMRWALIDKAHGVFVGALGFNSIGPCSEIAYHLHPAFWGRGLMTEAATTAISWVRDVAGAETLEAFIDAENFASIRLAQRLGMRLTGDAAGASDRYLMALTHG